MFRNSYFMLSTKQGATTTKLKVFGMTQRGEEDAVFFKACWDEGTVANSG